MTKLVITRGYPASGKSRWAKQLCEGPAWARVSRDDLRQMLFDKIGLLPFEMEQRVTIAEKAQAEALLRAGTNVVIDATNLRLRWARDWADLAKKLGVEFECKDFPVSAGECMQRDNGRDPYNGEYPVGDDVIRKMAQKFPIEHWQPVTSRDDAPEFPVYTPDPDLPPAYVFDIDGTLATMADRDPYDYSRVGEDAVHRPVVQTALALRNAGYRIVVLSGREDVCYNTTLDWLRRQCGITPDLLAMRAEGDYRKDAVVKNEMFEQAVSPRYSVQGVFDDRNSVVEMWRAKGLMCAQVAEGDF
ncbi:phosphatase domain-containing protein [Nocardia jiangxiensis]|uniref:phosphatase domain-containing protein n=1 Tax=Nocardia jiangxiensis TaxID=282685 RepID=UPI000592DB96|nr:AAA family ATPase [Nocardia jiangxiensis]